MHYPPGEPSGGNKKKKKTHLLTVAAGARDKLPFLARNRRLFVCRLQVGIVSTLGDCFHPGTFKRNRPGPLPIVLLLLLFTLSLYTSLRSSLSAIKMLNRIFSSDVSKSLRVIIITPYRGPGNLPAIYATPEQQGRIQGYVEFESTEDIKARDLDLTFRIKSEGRWSRKHCVSFSNCNLPPASLLPLPHSPLFSLS